MDQGLAPHDDDESYDEESYDNEYGGDDALAYDRYGPRKPPFWHRDRLRWVNGLGFAVTAILALWIILIPMSLLQRGKQVPFSDLPVAYLLVLGISAVATVLLLVNIFRYMGRGEDLSEPGPRRVLFYWAVAGTLYFLVLAVTLGKFGQPVVGSALWIPHLIFCGVGLLGFALLIYVNSDLPDHHAWHDGDDWHHDEDDLDEAHH